MQLILGMATKKVVLADLPSNSRVHFTRLQVLKKFAPIQNVGRAKFQRLVLKDEMGEKIRLTLFGDYIDIYGTILQQDAFYDFSNVTIKDGNSGSPYPQGKLMYINDSSSVLAVDHDDTSGAFAPSYLSISETFKIDSVEACFDLVAVLVQVGVIEGKITKTWRSTEMLKLYITDDSCTDVVPVVLWDATAHDVVAFVKLVEDREELVVIGFQGLRKNFYRGTYSFLGNFECRVSFFPDGLHAERVKKWSEVNVNVVQTRQRILTDSFQSRAFVTCRTITEAISTKASEIAAEGLVKVYAYIRDFKESCIRTALGCKNCGRGCMVAFGEKYDCISCKRSSICIAKLYFDFTACDDTGSMSMCAQTRTAEFILGIKAHAFHTKTHEERANFFRASQDTLQDKVFPLVLSPANSLLLNHGLVKWTLKYVDKE